MWRRERTGQCLLKRGGSSWVKGMFESSPVEAIGWVKYLEAALRVHEDVGSVMGQFVLAHKRRSSLADTPRAYAEP
jgi:hypothetical protein